jgi:glycosyltransferase involved in cell wall biosynthesis/peptidoglycan/xylan/chitin deacetylase (PgdA/CDA1 family)
MTAPPRRFSIVIPTFNRRDVLLDGIASVVAARRPWPCELIVVVDGSTDGTLEAVEDLDLPLPLTVLFQGNQGAAAARNLGAAAAHGCRLLFLDDDMTIDPELLVEHDRALGAGADVAVGHMRLDARSPHTILSRGVQRWAETREARLERSAGRLGVADFLSGQLSVSAEWFSAIGGFDEDLNAKGTFGGEDTDLVFRLMQAGAWITFVPRAVSYQRYVVTAEQNIRQWRQAGRADVTLSVKHPGLGATLFANHQGAKLRGRTTRVLAALPESVTTALESHVVKRVDDGRLDLPTEFAFAKLRDVSYWRGNRESGGIRATGDAGVRILAYHSVEEVDDAQIGQYCVSPERFATQIHSLLEAGHTFIDTDTLLEHLDGRPLKPGSVLLTFDDAYRNLIERAVPVLSPLGISGVVCVVSSQLGGVNAWDADSGAAQLPLLTAAELRDLRASGWEIASHTERHAHLTALDPAALRADLERSRAALAEAVGTAPRLVAYPYGEHNRLVRAATRATGHTAGMALTTGRRVPSGDVRYTLPRIEVQRDTTPGELLHRLAAPPRSSVRQLMRGELSGMRHRLPSRLSRKGAVR